MRVPKVYGDSKRTSTSHFSSNNNNNNQTTVKMSSPLSSSEARETLSTGSQPTDTPNTDSEHSDKHIITVPIKDALFQLARAIPASENRNLRIRWDTTISEVISEAAKLLRHVDHPIVLLENFHSGRNPNNQEGLEPMLGDQEALPRTPAGKERIGSQYEQYKDIMYLGLQPYISTAAPPTPPESIYKILLFPPLWPLSTGVLDKSNMGVHMCTAPQVLQVLRGSMRDVDTVWVLKVRYEDVVEKVRWVEGFPRLIGTLERRMVGGTAMMVRVQRDWTEGDWEGVEWREA
jgi:hypothetical protein